MDYLRDRYGVTNYDIGTPFALPFWSLSLLRAVETWSFETNVSYVFFPFLSFDRLLFADDIDARDERDRGHAVRRRRRQTLMRLKDERC